MERRAETGWCVYKLGNTGEAGHGTPERPADTAGGEPRAECPTGPQGKQLWQHTEMGLQASDQDTMNCMNCGLLSS